MQACSKSSRWVIAGVASGLAITAGPVATAAAAPSTTGRPTVTVAAGETLNAVAARFHTSVSQLAAVNGIRNPNVVVAGQRLRLPGTGPSEIETSTLSASVRIAPGETLSAVATRFHTTVAQLAAANGLGNPNFVVAGQVLRLQGAGPTAAPVSSSAVTVRVAAGETLSAIAARFQTTVAQLAAANRMSNPNIVIAGQVLHISGSGVPGSAPQPSSVTVTVAAGETLAAIAARAHTSVAELAAANGLRNPNFIYAGQVLHLSAAGWSAAVGSLPAALLAHPGRLVLRYLFLHAARDYGVSPRLLEALCWWESGWQQSAVSSTGAIGVCQMEPQTATYVNTSLAQGRALNVHSAADNITMAAALLHQLFHEANGNASLAIGGYYQGLPSITHNGMFPETRSYVRGIQAYASIFPQGG